MYLSNICAIISEIWLICVITRNKWMIVTFNKCINFKVRTPNSISHHDTCFAIRNFIWTLPNVYWVQIHGVKCTLSLRFPRSVTQHVSISNSTFSSFHCTFSNGESTLFSIRIIESNNIIPGTENHPHLGFILASNNRDPKFCSIWSFKNHRLLWI